MFMLNFTFVVYQVPTLVIKYLGWLSSTYADFKNLD